MLAKLYTVVQRRQRIDVSKRFRTGQHIEPAPGTTHPHLLTHQSKRVRCPHLPALCEGKRIRRRRFTRKRCRHCAVKLRQVRRRRRRRGGFCPPPLAHEMRYCERVQIACMCEKQKLFQNAIVTYSHFPIYCMQSKSFSPPNYP